MLTPEYSYLEIANVKVTRVTRRIFLSALALAGSYVVGMVASPVASAAEPLPLNASAYSVTTARASAKVGAVTTIVVTVTAGSGFKPNTEYPNKVKNLAASDAVALPGGNVKGSISGGKIVFSIPVTPKAAGAHTVTGTARFSVCNDKECLLESAPIRGTVTGT